MSCPTLPETVLAEMVRAEPRLFPLALLNKEYCNKYHQNVVESLARAAMMRRNGEEWIVIPELARYYCHGRLGLEAKWYLSGVVNGDIAIYRSAPLSQFILHPSYPSSITRDKNGQVILMEYWLCRGQVLGRDKGPAVTEYRNGYITRETWFENGKKSRLLKPAEIDYVMGRAALYHYYIDDFHVGTVKAGWSAPV